jgi:hypothetical protein
LLTPLQARLAEIITSLPEAREFALAGAGGLVVHGVINRTTRDLDYFAAPGDESAVERLRDALERALDEASLVHARQRDLPTFVRLEVADGADSCEVDLAFDYRALPIATSGHGPTLAVEELAANKVLALFDRAEARDFLDLDVLTRRFELRSLVALASQKDTGFEIEAFREALGSFDRFTAEDLGVSPSEHERLRAAVKGWLSYLDREQEREPPSRGPGLGL